MKNIILIHGRSQQGKSATELKQHWINQLMQGFKTAGLVFPDDVGFEFPYYGDLLIDEIKASKTANNSSAATSRGPESESDQARQFVISFYSELLENAAKIQLRCSVRRLVNWPNAAYKIQGLSEGWRRHSTMADG